MALSKRERLEIFLERLSAADPVGSAGEALELVAKVLNGVEGEFTSIPFNPVQWATDGRMYPSQPDKSSRVPGTNVTCYRNRHHHTWIADNGAIRITLLNGEIVFDKPGKNGKTVELA